MRKRSLLSRCPTYVREVQLKAEPRRLMVLRFSVGHPCLTHTLMTADKSRHSSEGVHEDEKTVISLTDVHLLVKLLSYEDRDTETDWPNRRAIM